MLCHTDTERKEKGDPHIIRAAAMRAITYYLPPTPDPRVMSKGPSPAMHKLWESTEA